MDAKGLRKVVWAEGVFLGQQHFQAWDTYQNQIHAFKTKIYEPFFWGIKEISWDKAALEGGRLVLVHCLAVFPNGQVIDYDRNRDLPVYFELSQSSSLEMDVQLTIADNQSVDNITGYNSQSNAAWSSEYVELPDSFDNTRIREVLLAQTNLALVEKTKHTSKAVLLDAARVVKEGDGGYRLDETYVPALVSVHASQALKGVYSALRELLKIRFNEINARRINVSDVASYTPSEMADFLLVTDLGDILSELNFIEQNPGATPFQLYSILCKAHDKLALHSHPDRVPYTQTYEHDELTKTFSELESAIRHIVGLNNVRIEAMVRFDKTAPGLYESSVINPATLDRCDFYLAVFLERSDSSWIEELPGLVKLASPEDIPNLAMSGLSGISIQHIQRVPSKIRIKSGYEYFQVDKTHALWERVRTTQKISGMFYGDFADASVELIPIDE